jgi:nucleoside-triphosphatase THEP1
MPKHIAILAGPFGSGKSTACCQLTDRVRQRGLDCAGIISPARFEGGVKVGIDVLDVRTDQRRLLAEIDDSPSRLRMTPYPFDTDAMAWAGEILNAACPCDLLIVDEIGPCQSALAVR